MHPTGCPAHPLLCVMQCWEHLSAPGNVASTFGSEAQFAARFPFLPDPPASAPTAGAAAANGAAPGTGASGGSGQAEAGEPGEPAGGAAAAGTGQAGANYGAGAGPVSATAAADRALLLRFALMLMLYQPPSAKGPSNPLAAAQAAAAGGGSAGRGPTPMEVDAAPGPGGQGTTAGAAPAAAAAAVASLQAGVPAGMSRLDVAAVEGKAPPSGGRPPQACLPGSFLNRACCCCVCHACAAGFWHMLTDPCPAVQAMRCCAASWASSTSRQPLGGTPPRYCRSTWQPPATQTTRSAGGKAQPRERERSLGMQCSH